MPSDDDDKHGMPVRAPGIGLSTDDLELLTLAARALDAVRVEVVEGEQWVNLHFEDGRIVYGWNPLLHSDDTFSLQVQLQITLASDDVKCSAQWWIWPAMIETDSVTELTNGEPMRAARRVVTRAAAEIAVAKENKQA